MKYVSPIMIGVTFLAGMFAAAFTILPAMVSINDGLSCVVKGCEDLAAQRSMALAAWAMVALTAATAAFGAASLALIYWTLRAAQASARAAEQAVAVAQSIGELQTRAYLSVSETNLTIQAPSFPAFTLALHNSGQSPARGVFVLLIVALHAKGDQTVVQLRQHVDDVPSQASMLVELPMGTNYFEIVGEGHMRARVDALITYEDVFGKKEEVRSYFYLHSSKYPNGTYRLKRVKKGAFA